MNMHSYIEIVSEQIRCRRAKQMILEELEGHIEDQKLDYMADGMNADEAEEEAVRQMGDPVETGMYMLRYLGSFPVVVLTLLVGVFLALLIRTVLGQRNRLGFLLGLAAVLFLSVQVVWYIGMNAGVFPVTEAYMPFYTQGGANLCVTYFYAGILLSIYRNSSVVKNER